MGICGGWRAGGGGTLQMTGETNGPHTSHVGRYFRLTQQKPPTKPE